MEMAISYMKKLVKESNMCISRQNNENELFKNLFELYSIVGSPHLIDDAEINKLGTHYL